MQIGIWIGLGFGFGFGLKLALGFRLGFRLGFGIGLGPFIFLIFALQTQFCKYGHEYFYKTKLCSLRLCMCIC